MNRGHKIRLKQNRAESLGCHDRHPLLAFFLVSRAAGTSKTDNDDTSFMPKWYVTAIIDIYMTSPSVSLWKTVQHRQDYLSRWLIKFRTQYNTKTGPQTDDVWRILWRQRQREDVATDFLRQPYMQHRSGGGFDTPIRYMGLQLLCLTDCIETCPYF